MVYLVVLLYEDDLTSPYLTYILFPLYEGDAVCVDDGSAGVQLRRSASTGTV